MSVGIHRDGDRHAAGEPEAATAYNARFDPANEAGQELYNAAFRDGFMQARAPAGDEDAAEEEYRREVDGVVLGEGWEASRDAFFAHLPLQAVATPAHAAGKDALERVRAAAQGVIDRKFSTYKARNGREVSIQGDDGEKCWIVHSDDIHELEAAIAALPAPVDTSGEVERMRDALSWLTRCASAVMQMLDEDGPKVVPHLVDTDDNAGQRTREAIEKARALLAASPASPREEVGK